MSTFYANIDPPPDLTPYIVKADAQYVAGGSFGDVYRSWCLYDGSPKNVAVKAFRFKFSGTNDRSAKRELGIWRRLNHPNVVPFLGIAYGFGICDAMSLVSLWMPNESLHTFLAKHDDYLGLNCRLRFLLDIANGLYYLHTFPIVHGDLNCNNMLLDADYTARLADFGYASLVGNVPEGLAYLQRSTTQPGALRWCAPEQLVEETFNRTPKSDIYSFGCIVFQVLSGKQPWSEVREDVAVIFRLWSGYKPGRPECRMLDDSHWNFIQHCWSQVEERPTAEALISAIEQFSSYYSRPLLGESHISRASLAGSILDMPMLTFVQTTTEDSAMDVEVHDHSTIVAPSYSWTQSLSVPNKPSSTTYFAADRSEFHDYMDHNPHIGKRSPSLPHQQPCYQPSQQGQIYATQSAASTKFPGPGLVTEEPRLNELWSSFMRDSEYFARLDHRSRAPQDLQQPQRHSVPSAASTESRELEMDETWMSFMKQLGF